MGKKNKRMRQQPLGDQLDDEAHEARELELKRKRMLRRRADGQGDAERDGSKKEDIEEEAAATNDFIDPKTSRKILQQASRQLAEEERGGKAGLGETGQHVKFTKETKTTKGGARKLEESDSEEEKLEDQNGGVEWDEEEEEEEVELADEDEDVEFRDGAVYTRGLSEAEQRMVSSFMDVGAGERRTLADIIMDKIREKEEEAAGFAEEQQPKSSITPKVREVYSEIRKMLKMYTAGKLPKAFKILPALANWEEVVYLTRPDEWTPHATYAATRIFASNLNAKLSQRFFNLILLEKCRDDILENKNLNYHYYMALKKAMYKPGAFFKGIILPLIQSGDCTIREATIIASVISKVSVPVNHAAVVLLKLATARDYSASCSIFLKALLNKKYTLPYRVIDALVDYFVRFAEAEGTDLPVLWQQSLLVFAQRYKEEITAKDKERLREVMKTHQHHQITPEIRRELCNCKCRGEVDSAPSDAMLQRMMNLG